MISIFKTMWLRLTRCSHVHSWFFIIFFSSDKIGVSDQSNVFDLVRNVNSTFNLYLLHYALWKRFGFFYYFILMSLDDSIPSIWIHRFMVLDQRERICILWMFLSSTETLVDLDHGWKNRPPRDKSGIAVYMRFIVTRICCGQYTPLHYVLAATSN